MERLTVKSVLGGWTALVPKQAVVDRLAAYEDTGLEPEEVDDLKNELDTAKEAICQMCRKRGEEQQLLCGCATCKYGGKKNGI